MYNGREESIEIQTCHPDEQELLKLERPQLMEASPTASSTGLHD
jgi:hypothetical protein